MRVPRCAHRIRVLVRKCALESDPDCCLYVGIYQAPATKEYGNQAGDG